MRPYNDRNDRHNSNRPSRDSHFRPRHPSSQRPSHGNYPPRHSHQGQRPSYGGSRGPDDLERKFFAATAIDPSPRIRLEDGSKEFTMRAMDLICPIGKGQRGLIVAPPGSGKTTFLKHICQAVAKSHPEIKLYCLLIDERPEEVTDFKRAVTAEVRASSSDQTYENHLETAHTLMRQAYREVSEGKDVMVVIDSLTRLARVHNADMRSGGRTLSGGVDARAMEVPRRIFGAARKIENGGSLSILATILVETGSRMDDVIFEEFKGTGNMEIYLSREISNRRIFPAIDISKSNTRKENLLMDEKEYVKVSILRRALAELGKVEAISALLGQLQKHSTNQEILSALK